MGRACLLWTLNVLVFGGVCWLSLWADSFVKVWMDDLNANEQKNLYTLEY